MATALIAGLTQASVSRVRKRLDECALPDGWKIRYVPSANQSRYGVSVDALEETIRQMSATESPHIFGVSDTRDERQQTERRLTPHFRLRWLNSAPFLQQSLEIKGIVEKAVIEEEEWRQRIMPQNEKAALVLPSIFHTKCHGSDPTIWQRAMKWGDPGNITAAERLLHRFEQAHLKPVGGKRLWVDDRGLVWDFSGERHALNPVPRNWKFSLKLPDRFHYDVAMSPARAYSLRDALGTQHMATKGPHHHLNIDAHGYVR